MLRRQGRRAEAIDRLDRRDRRRAPDGGGYRGRALARLERGDAPASEKEEALRDLEASAHLEPPGSLAAAGDHLGRARVLLSLGQAEEAQIAADSALAIAPDLVPAHVARGRRPGRAEAVRPGGRLVRRSPWPGATRRPTSIASAA